jgi:hypothetical protein
MLSVSAGTLISRVLPFADNFHRQHAKLSIIQRVRLRDGTGAALVGVELFCGRQKVRDFPAQTAEQSP